MRSPDADADGAGGQYGGAGDEGDGQAVDEGAGGGLGELGAAGAEARYGDLLGEGDRLLGPGREGGGQRRGVRGDLGPVAAGEEAAQNGDAECPADLAADGVAA